MLAKSAHLQTNDSVGLGVERVTPSEDGHAQHVLLEGIAATRDRFVDDET
jgi:hypothetical protein